jgi:hypothetical protein
VLKRGIVQTHALRVLLFVSLVSVALVHTAAAQSSELSNAETFLVNVMQGPPRMGGGPTDHYLTFPRRVEVPGAVLGPGTYLFRLMTPSVVQVMSDDRQKVYTMFMTMRADGPGDISRERMMFQHVGDEDGTLRILGWYPRDVTGYEFIYPRPKRKAPVERPR